MKNDQVFIDASFWIALRHQREEYHPRSREIAAELFADRIIWVSTMFVFAETHTFVSRWPQLSRMVIEDITDNPVFKMEPVQQVDNENALKILGGHRDNSYSFCDAVSFGVMERLGVRRVVTFDRHFEQFGNFELIN